MSDVLSDVMQRIRLKSCVYFQRDFHAPWAMRISGTGFAQFHVITRGACVAVANEAVMDCSAGDVLLFPRGAEHVLADATGREPVDGPDVMASFSGGSPCFAEGGAVTRVICGHYETRADVAHPLLSDLPDCVHVRMADVPGASSSMSVLPLILSEMAGDMPGQALIVERYAEILLIHTLRMFYAQSGPRQGFFAGLADRRLARAISLIHREFSRPVSLDELAGAAAMSRSSFAHHFRKTTGLPPIDYLAKWRMLVAGDTLLSTDLSIADVAENVGYATDISFARAFKREHGVTPSLYRRSV